MSKIKKIFADYSLDLSVLDFMKMETFVKLPSSKSKLVQIVFPSYKVQLHYGSKSVDFLRIVFNYLDRNQIAVVEGDKLIVRGQYWLVSEDYYFDLEATLEELIGSFDRGDYLNLILAPINYCFKNILNLTYCRFKYDYHYRFCLVPALEFDIRTPSTIRKEGIYLENLRGKKLDIEKLKEADYSDLFIHFYYYFYYTVDIPILRWWTWHIVDFVYRALKRFEKQVFKDIKVSWE